MKIRLNPKKLLNFSTYTALGALATLSVTVPQAVAVTIVRNFSGGTTPGNAVGGGNLVDIFDAAADWWQLAILDNLTLTINFGWAALSGGTLGQTTISSLPIPPTQANIQFDNDGSSNWFLDPTPHQNEEYQTFSETQANLGGGPINTGRVYTNPIGAAVGKFDLLSVAKHEIGHALGFFENSLNPNLPNPFTGNSLVTTAPRPNPGTQIPLVSTGGGHINQNQLPNVLLEPFASPGERKLQSGVDILAIAQASQFTQVNLNPVHKVPEPTPTPLALGLAIGIGALLRNKSSNQRKDS